MISLTEFAAQHGFPFKARRLNGLVIVTVIGADPDWGSCFKCKEFPRFVVNDDGEWAPYKFNQPVSLIEGKRA